MKLKIIKSFLFCSLLYCLSSANWATELTEKFYLGIARSQTTHKIVYYELHQEIYKQKQSKKFVVTYLSPAKKIFATRTDDFSYAKLIPRYNFQDRRFGYKESIIPISNNRFNLKKRVSWNEPIKRATLIINEKPMIIDDGFQYFIKNGWKKLTKKNPPLYFSYILASKLNYYSLLLLTTKITKTNIFFQIKPSNILSRWLASPIKLKYDRKTKNLLDCFCL